MTKNTSIKRSTGNTIYSIVGWFCYIACTIISAILNIYLLSNLDSSNWKFFMLTMSLALEFGKAYVLIRANTYKSLAEYLKNCKFSASKVKSREKTFYGIYLLFALLSITASLSFSLTITDKTQQGFDLEKQKIIRNIDNLNNINSNLDNANNSRKELEEKIEKLAIKEAEYDVKTNNLTKRIANQRGWDINSSQNKIWGLPEYKLSEEKTTYDQTKKEKSIAEESLKNIKEEINGLINEKNNFVKNYGTINDMNNQLDFVKDKEKEESGSSKMFILIAETFGIPDQVQKIKFFILMFVSLLVELCIWLSSPDLRLDGSLLYSFRNDLGLSTKRDVDKLLKEIKDTNTRFSTAEKKQEAKVVEKIPQKTLKEIDNLKEQIEVLNREKEENLNSSNDELNKYKEQIDELSNKISSYEDNEDKISELNEKLEKAKELYKKEIGRYQEENEELSNKNSDLENQINNTYDSYNSLEEKNNKILEEKDSKIKDLEKQLDIGKENFKNLNEQFSSLRNNTDNECKSIQDDLKKEKNKNSELKEKVNKIKELYKGEIEGYKKQIEELSKNKYTEEDIKKAIKDTADKSKEEINNLSTAIKGWKNNNKKLNEENSNLIITNKSLERKLSEKEDPNNQRVRTAEEEIKEMIDEK